MKHHIAASTLTVLTLTGGALGVAAVGGAPAWAASCATVTVSSSGPASALVLSVSSVTVRQGGCVTFHNSTSESAKVTVDGSSTYSVSQDSTSGDWAASSAGAHGVVATEPGLLGVVPKPGAGTITVTPKATPPPVPSPSPTKASGGSSGKGGSGKSGSGSKGGSGGGSAAGSGGRGHSTRGAGSSGHSSSTGKRHHAATTASGGLLSSGTGFSLPSIPLGTFSHEGLAGMTDGTAPQLAPQIATSTDAAGNPLPLVNGSGTQQMSLAGDSHSSGGSPLVPAAVAGVVILGTGAAVMRSLSRRRAVDTGGTPPAHRA